MRGIIAGNRWSSAEKVGGPYADCNASRDIAGLGHEDYLAATSTVPIAASSPVFG